MSQDIFKRINSFPCTIFLDVVVDIAVCDDLVILVVDVGATGSRIRVPDP